MALIRFHPFPQTLDPSRDLTGIQRTLSLPIPVEAGQVKATYRDGVLTVKLPKAEGVKPREIQIDAV
jgi:HSP20 family molecular chaperone IbpA